MVYETKNFEHLLGLPGFSSQLLLNHFKLYQGYVANANKLSELLAKGESGTPEFSELTRRFGWEFNGMKLHELYFGNITKNKTGLRSTSPLCRQIVKDFASRENCEKSFASVGAMRGIGWAVMCFEPNTKKILNIWINEHDAGHLIGTFPLLVIDVFEHAFMLDYGLNRADYIKAFMSVIDWKVVEERFVKMRAPSF